MNASRAGRIVAAAKLPPTTADFHAKLVAMNEHLVLRSMRQDELVKLVGAVNSRLQREIIERTQAEEAANENEKRYRTLFDLAPFAIYSCDAAGVIQECNRGASQLWGRQPKLGANGERFCGSLKLFLPDGTALPHRQCPMAEVLSGKKAAVRDTEVIVERPDGSRITAIVNIRALKNREGKITGAINCFFDITERKQAEEAHRRIRELGSANERMQLEIAQRRAVEEALNATQRHQLRLVKEARDMHGQLRLLSRQLLSAQEEERKRISRELHDVIAQTLAGISLQLATLKNDGGVNAADRARTISRTQQLVTQSVDVVHQFARELRPALLDHAGLTPALLTFLTGFKKDTGIQVSLSVFADIEQVNADDRIVFYRIAQEALTNVARHAKASKVDISIRKAGAAVCMTIKDNGQGIHGKIRNGTMGKRLGLLGMRERLEMVGGHFAIESSPGKGTTVSAKIPLRKTRAKGGRKLSR